MKKFIENPLFTLFGWLYGYAGAFRALIIVYVSMFACAQLLSLTEPYVIGLMLNEVQKGGSDILSRVSGYLLYFVLLELGFWMFHGPARVIERTVAFNAKIAFRKRLFDLILALPVSWHREHHSGETIDKLNRAASALGDFGGTSFEVLYMIFRLTGAHLALLYFSPRAGLTVCCVSVFAFGLVYLFDRKLIRQYYELNRFENRISSAIFDYLSNIVTVITLRLGDRVSGELEKRLHSPTSVFKNNIAINEVKWFLVSFTITLMTAAVAYGFLGSHQTVQAGSFFTLFEYLRRIGESYFNFAGKYGTIVRQAADLRGAYPIFEAYDGLAERSRAAELPAEWKRISIENLHFVYEDEEHRSYHLENVSLELERGRSIAIIGESGSGKSTFLKVLRGLHEADSGRLLFDGLEAAGGMRALHRHTTLLPQDPEIFADTIEFNITFGLAGGENDVEEAMRLARFEPVLQRLPTGLATNLAEKGINLSGGEKQRLALARGIFFSRDSEVILLDEATSSVDTVNELQIFKGLLELYRNRVVIATIHKLHLLELFDRVVVFEKGAIVESGSFAELLARKGRCYSMWQVYERDTEGSVNQVLSEEEMRTP